MIVIGTTKERSEGESLVVAITEATVVWDSREGIGELGW